MNFRFYRKNLKTCTKSALYRYKQLFLWIKNLFLHFNTSTVQFCLRQRQMGNYYSYAITKSAKNVVEKNEVKSKGFFGRVAQFILVLVVYSFFFSVCNQKTFKTDEQPASNVNQHKPTKSRHFCSYTHTHTHTHIDNKGFLFLSHAGCQAINKKGTRVVQIFGQIFPSFLIY